MWKKINAMIEDIEMAGYETRLLLNKENELVMIIVIDQQNNVVHGIREGDYKFMNDEVAEPRDLPWECDYFLCTIERDYPKPSPPTDCTYEICEAELDITLFSYLTERYKAKYPAAENAEMLLQEYAQDKCLTITICDKYSKLSGF